MVVSNDETTGTESEGNIKIMPTIKKPNNSLQIFWSKISVEPLLFVSLFTIVMYSTISQQYIYQQVANKYGLLNTNESLPCKAENISNVTKELQAKVSAETSTWVLYLNIAGFIPSFFCTILIGAWGDVVGRKSPLLFSFTGFLLMIITYYIVIQFNLNVAFLLIARIVAGLTGDFNCILASCYAYLADISSAKNRTFKVAVGEASTGLGGFLASIVSGIWIDAQGFIPPLWLLFALLIASIVYIIFFLDDKHSPSLQVNICCTEKLRALFSLQPFKAMWMFLNNNWQRSVKVLAIGLCFFLQISIHDGTGDVVIVYELSYPLCWTSLLIGFGSAIRDSAYLFGIAFIKFLSNRLSDLAFILTSSLSTISGLILYGVATSTWMMFVGYSLAVLRTVSSTVLRSMMSRLIGKHEQGAGFAIIACLESTALLVASFLFNGVYSATVHEFRGAVFFLGAGMQVLFCGLAWFVYLKTKQDLTSSVKEYRRFSAASADSSFNQ